MRQINELAVELVPLAELKQHPMNPRQGDVGAICQSLEAHGQYRTIVVQKSTGHICAGNHTAQAARALGWTHIAAHVLDIDDDQALRILLQDNRASDMATYDDSVLTDLLEHLIRDTALGLEGTGFTGDDLDDLLAPPIEKEEKTNIPQITQPGDVWILGEHRLTAGDQKLHQVDRLCNVYQGMSEVTPILEATGEEVSFVD